MNQLEIILAKNNFTLEEIVYLLQTRGAEQAFLHAKAEALKLETIGNRVHLRGLIEYSNRCSKNCYYCGIRMANKHVERYVVSDEEVVDAAIFAYKNKYGSLVLQAGECSDNAYILHIENLLKKIMQVSNGELGITLSLGEQSRDTYKRWKEAGATRYLLRIEASNKELYEKLHPANHSYEKRLRCLYELQDLNYQVGTGVMIGLPFQSTIDLANDLLFFKSFDIDMVGMGPYIEHKETPLYAECKQLLSHEERYQLSLNMIAVLRLMMPYINMAASTAMGSIVEGGREAAIRVGANILMPNITPFKYRENYFLYDGKICIEESQEDDLVNLKALVSRAGSTLGWDEHGDSKHYWHKQNI
ncbi:MAG: [FeFe] hydrogenase H-cluster radical SAM maturase HydE [Bacteroidales bacterium]